MKLLAIFTVFLCLTATSRADKRAKGYSHHRNRTNYIVVTVDTLELRLYFPGEKDLSKFILPANQFNYTLNGQELQLSGTGTFKVRDTSVRVVSKDVVIENKVVGQTADHLEVGRDPVYKLQEGQWIVTQHGQVYRGFVRTAD
jgi:hypothetical protein